MSRSYLSPLAVLLALRMSVFGDAVILQNGERVEGKIVRQSSDALVIEVQVSAGIIDSRTYQQTEIKEVEKESPDQAAYQALATLKPGPNSLMPADYDEAVAQLRTFVRTYPNSAFKPVIQENIKTLLAEQQRVELGELKQGGKWLDAEDVRKNRYQIEAGSVFDQMKQLAQVGNYVAALNAFDTLETEYPGSKAYSEALPIARQVIRALTAEVARKKLIAEREEDERKKGVDITSEPKKSQLIAFYKSEQAEFKALLAQATAEQIKWPPLIPRSPESIVALEKLIPTEETRLSAIDAGAMQTSLRALDRAKAALASGDSEQAKAQLEIARKDWPANEAIKTADAELKKMEADAVAAKALENASPAAADPSASPATSRPPATPAAPAPKPPASALEAETPAAAVAQAPTLAPTPAAAPVTEVSEEEPLPFYKTVKGAIAIAAGALIIATAVGLLGKIKKPAPPEESAK